MIRPSDHYAEAKPSNNKDSPECAGSVHPLQCQCGALRGFVDHTDQAVRGICYCGDCRAYSRHLGKEAEVHDAEGGVEFIATQGKHVHLTEGVQYLACLSLSERGPLRWYTRCCNTPIANTMRTRKFGYAGVIHSCLKVDAESFERSFPRVRMRVNTRSALRPPPTMPLRTFAALLGFVPRVLWSGVNGTYRRTPFFSVNSGAPIATPRVLTDDERRIAYGVASQRNV